MSDASSTILDRIRAALTDVPTAETADQVSIVRDYQMRDVASRDNQIDKFIDRVAEYRATIQRVKADELPAAISSACLRRGVKKLVVPADVPETWIPPGVVPLRDFLLTNEQLNSSDGVLTGCALGIAQTGTIVLDCGKYQGRRALTLLPDYHLCVIREDQVVGVVPEAVALLVDSARRPERPQTWISGPSATSDIELNRVEGVHGPRTLEVLVVS